MSNLINFDFQSQTVRVELKNGEPLFCLTDVATILEITNANPSRFNLSNDGVHKMYSVDSKGRKNEITFINEPNLYRVIFRSNKAEAEKFQNWVFDEVLPSIRKTGSYSQKTTAQQRQALVTACDKLAVGNTLRSDIYKMVGNQFGVDDIQSIPMHQLADATAFVYEIILAKQQTPKTPELPQKTIERLASQLAKTAELREQVKKDYLPFLANLNQEKGEKLSSLLTLLHYDIQDNVTELLKMLPPEAKNKNNPIYQNLERAYYENTINYLLYKTY